MQDTLKALEYYKRRELEAMESRGKRQEGFWETLTGTLLCQEIYRRRCRRNRCRKLW